ncbi:MAG TPA: hypothetical protein ENK85_08410 [Saprospiraceae bacterium]|nr:hypothetical protein [Saprospiraceae bacterium]
MNIKMTFLKIVFVFLISLQTGYAQCDTMPNFIPAFLEEQIEMYDSIAFYRESERFYQKFGVTIQNGKIMHITRLKDSLIIYPLFKKNKIENLLITSVKGEVYLLNKMSTLTKENVKNTPIHQYFKRFFSVLTSNFHQETNSFGYWEIKKRCYQLSLCWKPNSEFPILCFPKGGTRKIQSNEFVDWGQEEDGDFTGIITSNLLKLIKERSPKGTDIEMTWPVMEGDDAQPTFSSLFSLVQHLDATNLEFEFIATGSATISVPKELRGKLQLVCELRNSKNETIDEFFSNQKPRVIVNNEKYISTYFLMDDKFMEAYSLLLKKKLPESDSDFVKDFQKLTGSYPVCFDALPQILRAAPN